jgi:hypothetical protein
MTGIGLHGAVVHVDRAHDHDTLGANGLHRGPGLGLSFLRRDVARCDGIHGDTLSAQRSDLARERVFGARRALGSCIMTTATTFRAAHLQRLRLGILPGVDEVAAALRR